MMRQYAVLAGRLRQEIAQIEHIVLRVQAVCQNADLEDTIKSESLALNLQSFYTGVERLLQLVASSLDGGIPKGSDRHRQLLQQMIIEVHTVRPAILRPTTARSLDEYLRFRHIVRNLYAFELDNQRIQPLASGLQSVYEELKQDIDHFVSFLDEVALS
ncbi:MAG: hypothetical protein ACOX4G_09125 [Limnochordia bacterium]|jgi:hypothetical protein